jgi:aryl-alcohol dehydrogenase-like predicted oxidoreductase
MCDHTPSNSTTHGYSRRQFITTALAGAGVLAAGTGLTSGAEGNKKKGAAKGQAAKGQAAKGQATDIVTLGATGIKATRIAQGTGWNGSDRSSEHTRLGQEAFTKLVRHSIDQGIAFIDTADLYGSMPYVGRALKGVPQDKYIVLSKIWPRQEFWNSFSGGAIKEVDRFRKELNRDVLDICLIHCMTNGNWPTEYERVRDELSELKQKGVVRAVGVSCHDLGAIKAAAALPWTDVILARINNVGKEALMDAPVEEVAPVLKQARAGGKVVLGMKIFGAGALTKPEQKDASLKYVWQNQLVDAITVGMLRPTEVDDTLERLNKALKA